MPLILVTNDDGIDAPGLHVLASALREAGEIQVLAPDHNWSAAGLTKTMHKPLRVNEVRLPDGTPARTSNGAPSDCVALALLGILPRPPDLIFSGINSGANLGHDIAYSGTVAAALEGCISGIPSLALSLDGSAEGDFEFAARFAIHLAREITSHGLSRGTLLNVNFPALPRQQIAGVMITRLGQRVYRDGLIERRDPRGRKYYWIGGARPESIPEEGTDVWAVARGYVSITPLHLDMTDYRALKELRNWRLDLG
ncbi:MAG: 5'/3'-nucleotidase SurE [Chloroflexi bacterium]|nr:5'/3'-nucleotidase SurE [Chloroflexota bacterium]